MWASLPGPRSAEPLWLSAEQAEATGHDLPSAPRRESPYGLSQVPKGPMALGWMAEAASWSARQVRKRSPTVPDRELVPSTLRDCSWPCRLHPTMVQAKTWQGELSSACLCACQIVADPCRVVLCPWPASPAAARASPGPSPCHHPWGQPGPVLQQGPLTPAGDCLGSDCSVRPHLDRRRPEQEPDKVLGPQRCAPADDLWNPRSRSRPELLPAQAPTGRGSVQRPRRAGPGVRA